MSCSCCEAVRGICGAKTVRSWRQGRFGSGWRHPGSERCSSSRAARGKRVVRDGVGPDNSTLVAAGLGVTPLVLPLHGFGPAGTPTRRATACRPSRTELVTSGFARTQDFFVPIVTVAPEPLPKLDVGSSNLLARFDARMRHALPLGVFVCQLRHVQSVVRGTRFARRSATR